MANHIAGTNSGLGLECAREQDKRAQISSWLAAPLKSKASSATASIGRPWLDWPRFVGPVGPMFGPPSQSNRGTSRRDHNKPPVQAAFGNSSINV